ncbi:hypothetical protein J6590_004231 [Homalodisca vitripennis]|nr:hypothetical protein J6590_004231 [Homalodisca vitripennis]
MLHAASMTLDSPFNARILTHPRGRANAACCLDDLGQPIKRTWTRSLRSPLFQVTSDRPPVLRNLGKPLD